MQKKYYIKNFPKGFIILSAYTYFWYNAEDCARLDWVLLYFIIGCFLFPYSKLAIEKIALRYTSEEFWNTGFFANDIGKSGIIAIYWLLAYVMSPISLIIILIKSTYKAK
ncbi:colicin E1 family microcin immunity protein [Pantoea sp. EA-12]|uniref:colicin E1 family microcin immunity protein n=1 Tax=Pantoea sp. EA-12 TaxID=3043303 RepID=UPI0024B4A7F6|nr:colicin E1 family microcin immunity protein [Pantoea sp. EA-12]MDI9221011.1 colicin E1 family microcin immunity protein [Pantoea sp. EA-12]